VYSNLVSDPIDCDREAYEAEKGFGQLFIAGTDSAVAFDAAKEGFDRMTVSIKRPIEAVGDTTGASRWNAYECAGVGEVVAEGIGVESAITNDPMTAELRQQRFAGTQVVLGTGREMKADCTPDAVDHSCKLGVESALWPPDRLGGLASIRVGPVLMNLDVGAVDTADPSARATAEGRDQASPEPRNAPSSEARVDGTPRAKLRRKVSPRHASPENIPHCSDHKPVIFRRPASIVTICQIPTSGGVRSIFLAAPRAARITPNDLQST
jgi:hypothetical protein